MSRQAGKIDRYFAIFNNVLCICVLNCMREMCYNRLRIYSQTRE